MFQELINCCCYLLKERAKSHVFVLLMFPTETSDFVVVDEKMLRKGHQITFQHGCQYGSLFICSFTCYLLKPSIHSAWTYTSPACLYGKHPFLKIIFWLHLLTPFCVRGTLQQIFSAGNTSANTGMKTAQKKPLKKQPTPHKILHM